MEFIWYVRSFMIVFCVTATVYSMLYLDLCGIVYPLVNVISFGTAWEVCRNVKADIGRRK
jgi:hypothetical protein